MVLPTEVVGWRVLVYITYSEQRVKIPNFPKIIKKTVDFMLYFSQ
jgi:hypothetical protein